MRKSLIIAAITLAACSSNDYNDIGDMQPAPPSDVIATPTARVDWMSDIAPVGSSNVRGKARARTVGGATRIMVNIEGAPANTQHPWRIHKGACGEAGALVGNVNEYPVLSADAAGKASAKAQIAVPLSEQEAYHVNVLHSATDLNTVVACGRLAR